MSVLDQYPEIAPFLDTSDDYILEAAERKSGGVNYLVVTQRGQIDSGQLLFEITPQGLELKENDNAIEIGPRLDSLVATALVCAVSTPSDIDLVHEEAVRSVDSSSSARGPDGGNLACVWAVRHIAKKALGRWITKTDGTVVLDPEFRRCFGNNINEADVPAGGIIISPTEGRNIGHVGLLGPPTGDLKRLIYSNSSGAAMWKQNFTLESWIERYRVRKGLKVRFYPIPNYVNPTS